MIIATLCYLSTDEKTLMLYLDSSFMSGIWTAPGGKWESGKNMSACSTREYEEETGLKILDLRLRGTILFDNENRIFSNGKPAKDDYLVFVYTATKYQGVMKQPEKGRLKWIASENLPKLKVGEVEHLKFKLLELKGIFEARVWHNGSNLQGFDGFLYRNDARIPLKEALNSHPIVP